jgi:hypothetical protein
MNYKNMWEDLKAKIEEDLAYHKSGIMQSIGESVHGVGKCEEVLKYMEDIENKYNYIGE